MEVVEKDAASIAAAIAAALRNLAAKNKNVFAQQRLNSVPSSKSAPLPPSLLSLPPSSQSGSLAPLLGKWGKPGNCWHGHSGQTVASNSKWWNYLISFNYLHDSLILG